MVALLVAVSPTRLDCIKSFIDELANAGERRQVAHVEADHEAIKVLLVGVHLKHGRIKAN